MIKEKSDKLQLQYQSHKTTSYYGMILSTSLLHLFLFLLFPTHNNRVRGIKLVTRKKADATGVNIIQRQLHITLSSP